MSNVKERKIHFYDPMIRAIIEGRKTQARFIMMPEPEEGWTPYSYGDVHRMQFGDFVMRNFAPVVIGWGASNEEGNEAYVCPFGKPGDRLWVREAFLYLPEEYEPSVTNSVPARASILRYRADGNFSGFRWKKSIFMPRWASRITLEITGIRVERINDITESAALEEGIYHCGAGGGYKFDIGEKEHDTAVEAYFDMLYSLGKNGVKWKGNPWVWVIDFCIRADND